jgi:hypothetical protein
MRKLILATIFLSSITLAKKEADYVNENCKGVIEYRLPDRTRVDCLMENYAIEYDYSQKWAEAIGQSLYYSAMTDRKAGIVLIIESKHNGRYQKRLNKVLEANDLDIKVWLIEKEL